MSGDVVENGVAAEVCIVWSVEVLDVVTPGSEEGVGDSGEELNVEYTFSVVVCAESLRVAGAKIFEHM